MRGSSIRSRGLRGRRVKRRLRQNTSRRVGWTQAKRLPPLLEEGVFFRLGKGEGRRAARMNGPVEDAHSRQVIVLVFPHRARNHQNSCYPVSIFVPRTPMLRPVSFAVVIGLFIVASSPAADDDKTYVLKFKELGKGVVGSYVVTQKEDTFIQEFNAQNQAIFDFKYKRDSKLSFWTRYEGKGRYLRGYGEARAPSTAPTRSSRSKANASPSTGTTRASPTRSTAPRTSRRNSTTSSTTSARKSSA